MQGTHGLAVEADVLEGRRHLGGRGRGTDVRGRRRKVRGRGRKEREERRPRRKRREVVTSKEQQSVCLRDAGCVWGAWGGPKGEQAPREARVRRGARERPHLCEFTFQAPKIMPPKRGMQSKRGSDTLVNLWCVFLCRGAFQEGPEGPAGTAYPSPASCFGRCAGERPGWGLWLPQVAGPVPGLLGSSSLGRKRRLWVF